MKLGHLEFRRDGEPGRRWLCAGATRGIYRRDPLTALLALQRWYRRDPRSHWPGCDRHHARGALCPQAR